MSNVFENVKADHHVFIIPSVVDAAVVATQASKKLKRGESTYVHHHRHAEACADKRHESYGSVEVAYPILTLVNNPT